MLLTLWSLIDGGVGIVGGLEKISKINSLGGWNSRGLEKISKINSRGGNGKKYQKLIAGGGGGWGFEKIFFF